MINDWLPRVADLVDAMIEFWTDLIPLKSKDGGRGAILFRCIHALMSIQVRGLIKRSLDHLYNALDVYKVIVFRRITKRPEQKKSHKYNFFSSPFSYMKNIEFQFRIQ